MTCKCGNKKAYRMRFTKDGEWCDKCLSLPPMSDKDVYFKKPYFDPHLIDVNDHRQKDGVWIESKRQKAEIMNRLNVKEVGDRVRGARMDYRRAPGGWDNV